MSRLTLRMDGLNHNNYNNFIRNLIIERALLTRNSLNDGKDHPLIKVSGILFTVYTGMT